jgi:multidrug resistance efflux pump
MRRHSLILMLLASCLEARDYPALLTGEVYSRNAQDIFTPHTPNWRASITMMAPEGQAVEPGDVVVRFDGTDTLRQLEQLRKQRSAHLALTDRDLAQLEKKLTQAEFAVKLARVQLELAAMKAELPEGLIGSLEHAENQLARKKAERELADAMEQRNEQRQALEARRQQAELDRRKADLTERWWQELLERLSVEASQPGYMIHSNHPWTRAKFQEGDSVRTSYRVAEVADTSDLAIRVWVNGVDRPHLQAGAKVSIVFDALPERVLEGRLESLSDSASKRLEWGNAAYFEGVVEFEAKAAPGLLPGMSARVEVAK